MTQTDSASSLCAIEIRAGALVDRLRADMVTATQATEMPNTMRMRVYEAVGYEGIPSERVWGRAVHYLELIEQRLKVGILQESVEPPVYPDRMMGCLPQCHWHGLVYLHDLQCVNAPVNRVHL
jgi:hypothetical protein